jgi:hypothetical protein
MACKKLFKKQLDRIIIDALEECYSVQLYNPSKTEASDKIIEEIIDFRNDLSSKIHQAKNKKDFASLHTAIDNAEEDFISKINSL